MDKSNNYYKQLNKKLDKKLEKLEKQVKKQKTRNKTRYKREKKYKRRNYTIKGPYMNYSTPPSPNVHKISHHIHAKKATGSYSPTINKELVTLASIPRDYIASCNLEDAYQLEEPLEIVVPNKYSKYIDSECVRYYEPEAEEYLLKNLKANKHVDPLKIVPPMQSHSNCWFNAMFVTFFISDKGRKFFHFLRQLMIKGIQKDKKPMPVNLRDAFALLNFGIDSCLQGTQFAYNLDTNSIILELFKQIPDSYKQNNPDIVNIDDAGNPILYYRSIINYLNNDSIQLLFLRYTSTDWKDILAKTITKMHHLPHIIVIEMFEEDANIMNKKPINFKVNNAKYQIDSAVVRDIDQMHFCATITCEGKEMGYDGMSFHRLVPFEWKNKLNSDSTWEFEGSKQTNGKPLKWNFMKCYQLLIYYRVE